MREGWPVGRLEKKTKTIYPGPRVRSADVVLVLGDEKKPRKRALKGRQGGESALSTMSLSDCGVDISSTMRKKGNHQRNGI